MQYKNRNLLILATSIISALFFSSISIAVDTPATAQSGTDALAGAPGAAVPAAKATDSNNAGGHRPANVTNNQVPITKENITVTAARIKPSMAGSNNSAAFVSIHNSNKAELVIVGATVVSSDKPNASSIANRIELHNVTSDSSGVAQMVQVNRLVVPIDGDLTMAPGGIHIMLLDLKRKLKEGDTLFINLVIQGLGTYQIPVTVTVL